MNYAGIIWGIIEKLCIIGVCSAEMSDCQASTSAGPCPSDDSSELESKERKTHSLHFVLCRYC